MHRLLSVLVSLLMVVISSTSQAHHGLQAHYDMKQPVVIEGTVKRFDAKNPHSYVYLNVTGDDGKVEEWKCEMPSLVILRRQNFGEDKLKPGDWFKLEGTRARRDPTACVMNAGYLADGSTFKMRFRSGNKDRLDTEVTIKGDILSGPDAILGSWMLKSFRPLEERTGFQQKMTTLGKQAHENYDRVVDDPALRCSAASPVRAWGSPGTPTEIRREGNSIIIHHEIMDVIRTVHLDSQHPKNEPDTEMGYSIGWFEGSTLVIESKAFAAGTFIAHAAGMGMLHSEELTFTERLQVDPETGVLELTWVADDPKYYTDKLTDGHEFVRTEYNVQKYNCKTEPERGA